MSLALLDPSLVIISPALMFSPLKILCYNPFQIQSPILNVLGWSNVFCSRQCQRDIFQLTSLLVSIVFPVHYYYDLDQTWHAGENQLLLLKKYRIFKSKVFGLKIFGLGFEGIWVHEFGWPTLLLTASKSNGLNSHIASMSILGYCLVASTILPALTNFDFYPTKIHL